MASKTNETVSRLKVIWDQKTGARYSRCHDDLLGHVRYQPISNIHAGDDCQVFLMEHRERSKEFLAAKVYNLDDEDFSVKYWETFRREVGILQELNHDNIVKCKLAIASPTLGVIFMDYIPEGTIRQHLTSPMLHKNIHRYFIQISSAVRHLHSKNIVHRDISLDNILVKNNTAFLTDFGMSRKLPLDSSDMFGLVGTLGFQAPEMCEASMTTFYNGFKADCYSLGVFLWCLMTKEEPNCYFRDLFTDVQSKKSVDIVLSECAMGLLQKNPTKRWSVVTLLDSMKRRGFYAWYIDALSVK